MRVVLKDHRVLRDHKVFPENMQDRAFKAHREPREPRVFKELLSRARKVRRVPKAHRVHKALKGIGTQASSTTSLTIGTGSKSFTTSTALGAPVGCTVQLTNGSSYMRGAVTANTSNTSFTFTVVEKSGSGTLASWTVNVVGKTGAQGYQGAQGYNGILLYTGIASLDLAVGNITYYYEEGDYNLPMFPVGSWVYIVDSGGTRKMWGTIVSLGDEDVNGFYAVVNVVYYEGTGSSSNWTMYSAGASDLVLSTTSLNPSTDGTKTFTTSKDMKLQPGNIVRLTSMSSPALCWIVGRVHTASGTSISIAVQDMGSGGAKTDWKVECIGHELGQGSSVYSLRRGANFTTTVNQPVKVFSFTVPSVSAGGTGSVSVSLGYLNNNKRVLVGFAAGATSDSDLQSLKRSALINPLRTSSSPTLLTYFAWRNFTIPFGAQTHFIMAVETSYNDTFRNYGCLNPCKYDGFSNQGADTMEMSQYVNYAAGYALMPFYHLGSSVYVGPFNVFGTMCMTAASLSESSGSSSLNMYFMNPTSGHAVVHNPTSSFKVVIFD